MKVSDYDCVILGAGAAGMICAAEALKGGRVLVVEHNSVPGEKIRISGGGRCNFTNLHCSAGNFLSGNPHFVKSALKGFGPGDFLAMVESHGIAWHEKTLGQLFCDGSAKQIIAMLLAEMAGAELRLGVSVAEVARNNQAFELRLSDGDSVACRNLVVATGGKSVPKMGATGLGYQIAARFGHAVTETRPALVPLTFGEDLLAETRSLSGIACEARVSCGKVSFDEAVLLTHRGISGPAILQISSFWREGREVVVNLLPQHDLLAELKTQRHSNGRRDVVTVLAEVLPRRLAEFLAGKAGLSGRIADLSDQKLAALALAVNAWTLRPTGSEGYRTAEVTLGGVDTDGLNGRTMESKSVPGLFFIGEVVDVTGWLGGYNFQWAWSSGVAAGRAVAAQRRS